MAEISSYTSRQVDTFFNYNINDDTTREDLLEWIVKLLPQDEFDSIMQEALGAAGEE